MKWQPIETAPKDGTRVLAVWDIPETVVEIVHWQDASSAWSLDDAWELEPQPTHWMPLPEPPGLG